MAGYQLYRELQDLEREANDLGFMFAYCQFRFDTSTDVFALRPFADQLPIYSRDADLFVGTHTEVRNFLKGVQWARKYNELIGACTTQRIAQYEAKEVARLERIKYNKEKAETFNTLAKEHV